MKRNGNGKERLGMRGMMTLDASHATLGMRACTCDAPCMHAYWHIWRYAVMPIEMMDTLKPLPSD